jgi:hypothetical protein
LSFLATARRRQKKADLTGKMAARPKLVSASDESGVLCIYDDDSKPKLKHRSYAREVLDVFLPAGYPHTVTADYTPYQIYVSASCFLLSDSLRTLDSIVSPQMWTL